MGKGDDLVKFVFFGGWVFFLLPYFFSVSLFSFNRYTYLVLMLAFTPDMQRSSAPGISPGSGNVEGVRLCSRLWCGGSGGGDGNDDGGGKEYGV